MKSLEHIVEVALCVREFEMRGNNMSIKRKTFIASVFLIIFLIICWGAPNQGMWLNWLGYVIYLYAVLTWHWEKNDKIFSLYAIFFTFLLLFNYGDCLMWALGIGMDRGRVVGKELVYGSNLYMREADLLATKWYVCLGMLAFHIGAMLLVKPEKKKVPMIAQNMDVSRIEGDRKALYYVGAFFTAIVTPIALTLRINEVRIAMRYGYNALYYGDMSTQGGYVQIILYLFFPALVALLIGSNFKKRVVWAVSVIFGIYTVLGIASGDRGSWLYSLLVFIWLYAQKHRIKVAAVVKLIILGVVGLYFLQVITLSRDGGGLSELTVQSFVEAFHTDNSPIVDAFFEMGSTMGIVTIFLKSGAIYPYANTYLTAILGAISSKFMTLLGIDFVLIADWLSQDYFGLTYGLGFSMIAEAYVNGGYVGGLIYMLILGGVIGKLLCLCRDNNDMVSKPIHSFVSIATVNLLMSLPRGAMYLVVKNFVYGVVLILVLVYLLRLKLRSRA